MRRLGDQGRPGKGRHCGQRKLAKVKELPGNGKGRMEKYRDCVNFRNIQLRPLRPLPRLINNDHSIRLTDKMRHFSPMLIINKQRNRKSPSSLRKYSSPLLMCVAHRHFYRETFFVDAINRSAKQQYFT